MATVIAEEAKLKIVIDTTAAPGPGQTPGTGPQAPGQAPNPPGSPGPNPPGGGPGAGRDKDDDGYDVIQHAKSLGRGLYAGGLYSAALQATIAASRFADPTGATAFGLQAAEFNRQSGPLATGALRALMPKGDSPVDQAVRQVLEGIIAKVDEGGEKFEELKAQLDSIAEALRATQEASFGAEGLGGIQDADEFFGSMQEIKSFQMQMAGVKERRIKSITSKAATRAFTDTLGKLFAGSSGR